MRYELESKPIEGGTFFSLEHYGGSLREILGL